MHLELKARITEDVKNAMRAGEKDRLSLIRMLQAAIKQREVDERIELTDADVLSVIDKMVKQRRDSITQFEAGKRQDLADVEKAEVTVLTTYCLLYTSPSPRDRTRSRMPSSA